MSSRFFSCYFKFILITGSLNNISFYSTPSLHNGTHIISFDTFVYILKKCNFLPATLVLPLACKFRSECLELSSASPSHHPEKILGQRDLCDGKKERNYDPHLRVLESSPSFGVGEIGNVTWRGRGHPVALNMNADLVEECPKADFPCTEIGRAEKGVRGMGVLVRSKKGRSQ